MAVCNERETELGELAWAAQWRNLATRRIVDFFLLQASVLQAASPPEQPTPADGFTCSTDSQSSPYPIYRQATTTTAHLRTQPQRYG